MIGARLVQAVDGSQYFYALLTKDEGESMIHEKNTLLMKEYSNSSNEKFVYLLESGGVIIKSHISYIYFSSFRPYYLSHMDSKKHRNEHVEEM
jgi:negative regulator of genetic competence, sporulation and motility